MQSYKGLRNLAVALPAALAMAGPIYAQGQDTKNSSKSLVYVKDNTACEVFWQRPLSASAICDTTYADGLIVRRTFLGGQPAARMVISPTGMADIFYIKEENQEAFKPEFDAVAKRVIQPENLKSNN